MAKSEPEEKPESEPETKTESPVSATLSKDIDASVEAAMKAMAAPAKTPEPDELDDGEEPGDDEAEAPEEKAEEKPEEPKKTAAPDDALFERAVRAGLPLAQAKQFTDSALLTAVCDRIEGAAAKPGSPGDAGKQAAGAGTPAPADPLAAIPDLDPNEIDERIVASFKALKGLLRQQQETIAGLREGRSQDWLSERLGTVKDFTKGDASKEAAVAEKFKVLTAGYAAAGAKVSREAVFDEAAKFVLAADMEAARKQAKEEAARKRAAQHLHRPGNNRMLPKGDVSAEIAAKLDRDFFRR